MATVRPRKNRNGEITSYTITAFLGKDSTGKQIRCNKSIKPDEIKAKTPKAIEKELDQIASDFEREVCLKPLDHSKDTFKQYAEYYINRKQKTGKQGVTSLQNNEWRLSKIYPVIGNFKIDDIKPTVIADAIEKIETGELDEHQKVERLSPVTMKDIFVLMNAIFEDAYKNDVIPKNPCANARENLPKIQKTDKTKFFEIDQARTFLKLFENDTLIWKAFFNLSLVSACRREELLGLHFKDIDYKAGVIRIKTARVRDNKAEKGKRFAMKDPKSESSEREIPILPEVMTILKEYETQQKKYWFTLRSGGWLGNPSFQECLVFASEVGQEISIDAPLRKMKRKINNYNKTIETEEDKLPAISLHCLRHTTASILENNGLPYSILQEFLGHSKAKSVTGTYTHVLKGNEKQIFDILKTLYKEPDPEIQAKTV